MFIFNNIINNLFSDILILGAPGTISSVLLSVSLAMFFICIMSRDSTFFFIRLNSYILANIPFIMFLPILYSFDIKIGLPQQTVPLLVETMKYFTYNPPSLFVDGISIFFILLTVFIIPLTLLVSWNVIVSLKEYVILFLTIEFFLILAFTVDDLFIFFIAFEVVLIPMFLIIGVWGSRGEKVKSAYWFFIFTLFGSIFFLYVIVLFYNEFGTTNFQVLKQMVIERRLFDKNFDSLCYMYWIFLFLAFAVKVPLFPFHVWLPEAHVEAPTGGSVVLASLLLKLGGYAIVRFLVQMFPDISFYYSIPVSVWCCLGVVYASFTAVRQLDIKRLIAYSSVAHMNFAILGVFAFKECDWAIASSVQMMVSHGVVSAAMFILVGMLYERHGVRTITYYVGVVALMPKYSFFVIFFTLANAGFPGLANFPAEFGILASVCVTSLAQALFALVGLFLTGVYSFWFVNRIIFGGSYRQNGLVSPVYVDLDFREFFILFQLALLTAVLGIRPDIVLDVINSSV